MGSISQHWKYFAVVFLGAKFAIVKQFAGRVRRGFPVVMGTNEIISKPCKLIDVPAFAYLKRVITYIVC